MPLWRSAIGRGSLRLTRVDVVIDVGVCYVSVAVLGETDSTAICQLRSLESCVVSSPVPECEICVVVDEFDVDFVARFLHFHVFMLATGPKSLSMIVQAEPVKLSWCYCFYLLFVHLVESPVGR